MPSDNSGELNASTEHRREAAERPSQYRPHVSRLRRLINRITRRA